MIDEFSQDRRGWARFSDDRRMRYRLARSLVKTPLTLRANDAGHLVVELLGGSPAPRVVWLMLNPSNADAWRPDNTVTECIKHSTRWDAHILEVVNLFAFVSPYPTDLKKQGFGFRGDDAENNAAILAACSGADRVIAAWGNHGGLDFRDAAVRALLVVKGIKVHHIGLTKGGLPKHPLARGKHRIASDIEPKLWGVP